MLVFTVTCNKETHCFQCILSFYACKTNWNQPSMQRSPCFPTQTPPTSVGTLHRYRKRAGCSPWCRCGCRWGRRSFCRSRLPTRRRLGWEETTSMRIKETFSCMHRIFFFRLSHQCSQKWCHSLWRPLWHWPWCWQNREAPEWVGMVSPPTWGPLVDGLRMCINESNRNMKS